MVKDKEIINTINNWKKKFRILKDWNIDFNNDGKYIGEVVRNTETKKAIIYGYKNNIKMPVEFIYHELLHICFADILETSLYEKKREKEEIFIQDLCRIKYNDIFNMVKKKTNRRKHSSSVKRGSFKSTWI